MMMASSVWPRFGCLMRLLLACAIAALGFSAVATAAMRPRVDPERPAANDSALRALPRARDADLRPTTQAPWNPSHALARRRTWERAVLMPERIVTLPLTALG